MTIWTGPAAKDALISAITAALQVAGEGDVTVHYGAAQRKGEDYIAVGDIRTTRSRPRIGQRLADEEHAIALTVGSARLGTDVQQQTCTERAGQLLDLVDAYLRAVAGEALSSPAPAGVYLAQIVGDITLTETSPDDEAALARGRGAEVGCTVTVRSRRT